MLESKVVLFAGIGRLGIPVARRLAEKNYRLSISYRSGRDSERKVRELISEIDSDKIFSIDAELTDEDEADRFIEESLRHYGRIDALINIASLYPDEKKDLERWEKTGEIQADDWKFYISNFISTRNTSLSALKRVEDFNTEDFSIINFADAYTLKFVDWNLIEPYYIDLRKSIVEISLDDVKAVGMNQLRFNGAAYSNREINPYTLAKRDISYLTKRMAVNFQGGKVRVNAIAPGPILPPADLSKEKAKKFVEITLLKRWGYEYPIVKTVEFLLENTFVTGHIIPVDGGADLYWRAKKQGLIE